ncbi:hypothetical protein NM688_g8145 [Phlebia brevispora]|uniref:Uncharacterized protein n=1 Tax=Phlebia brevispora TaxID=194682 RepID=A0ACC1RWX2_9APHY|nr:hypothetical protein NM688_g8145 [Phlebia brevispora]
MLVRDPSRRATARELLSHQYFKIIDVDWNDLDRSFLKSSAFTATPRCYGLEKAEPKARRVTAAAQALLDYERKERLQKGDPYSFSPEKYHAWD